MKPLAIRAAVATDLGALFAYLDDHLADNGRDGTPLFQPMPRSASRMSAEKQAAFISGMSTALEDPGWRRVWIAEDGNGAIAGHIDLRARPERPAAHRALLGMGVHRDYRRQGLGARLIELAVSWASAQTALDWIDLEVLSINAPARELYAATGFSTVGEIEDMFRIDGEKLGYTFMTRALLP